MSVSTLELSGSPRELLQTFGLLTFSGFLRPAEISQLRAAAETVRDAYHRHVDACRPNLQQSTCMRFVEEPIWHPDDQSHRLALMEYGADARFVGSVEQCLQGPAMYCSSSLFINPRSDSHDGDWHRDLQFIFYGDEAKVQEHVSGPVRGVQFQIALYDGDDVEYVPYSPTRYDSPEEYRVRVSDGGAHAREAMPHAIRVRQRAGDALLFNPNGLHRGRYHADKPRLTLMYTYTPFDQPQLTDFTYTPWMASAGFLEGLSRRARAFYGDYINHYQTFWESEHRQPAFR